MKNNTIEKPMAPPWIKYPTYSRYSLGWRMGEGENYIWKFSDWFDQLSESNREKYKILFKEPIGWHGWYDQGEEYEPIEFKPMYTYEKLLEIWEHDNQFDYVYFWGHQKSKKNIVTKSCFSQWWQRDFEVDASTFISAEQYMMAMKALTFQDQKIYDEILKCKVQRDIKNLGRQVKNFDEKTWQEVRYEIVVMGNYFKFMQNKELRSFLLSTDDKILVEASPLDKIWGVGLSEQDDEIKSPLNWKGENLLGFALMEVRENIREVYKNIDLLDLKE